jgi:hypothetical protein
MHIKVVPLCENGSRAKATIPSNSTGAKGVVIDTLTHKLQGQKKYLYISLAAGLVKF